MNSLTRHSSALLFALAACGDTGASILQSDGQATQDAALSAYASQLVDAKFPATLGCGATATATITMKNTGSVTWKADDGFKLGAVDDSDPLFTSNVRVFLPDGAEVPTGATATFEFELTGTASPGQAQTDWQMVHEGKLWFGAVVRRNVTIDCGGAGGGGGTPPAGGVVELCRGVFADTSGQSPATTALQKCADATPGGRALELPAGTYLMDGQLRLAQPIVLRTAGTAPGQGSCLAGVACATLKASPSLWVEHGFLAIAGSGVRLEHIVLDGNRAARLSSRAASTCAGGYNRVGFNATAQQCVGCSFIASASINALCGSGFEWVGDEATIAGSSFRDNGDNSKHMMWADGLTLIQSDGAVVEHNEFIDNSDIGFISGGSRGGRFEHNLVLQSRQLAFGGLMLDNFNGHSHGDFEGAIVRDNRIECTTQKCDYGVVVGPHAWYPSANTRGGTVTGNTITNAKMGVVVSGGGTADAPVKISGNSISGSPSSAIFLCGQRQSANYVISPDSHVDTRGDATPFARFPVTECP